jgi:HSP20 family protein
MIFVCQPHFETGVLAMARNSLVPFGFGGFEPVFSLHREMNRLFDDVMRGDLGGTRALEQGRSSGPASVFDARMNVSETDGEYKVTVELPGVTEQDVDLTVTDDLLTIRGEKKHQAERGGEKENFHYIERSFGTFQRSLRLPFSVNAEDVKASFSNGVLTISLPKSAQQERSRKIPIHSSAGSEGTQTIQAQQGDQGSKGAGGQSSAH